jgi:hypothetical protein
MFFSSSNVSLVMLELLMVQKMTDMNVYCLLESRGKSGNKQNEKVSVFGIEYERK